MTSETPIDDDAPLPPQLRFLKALVTVLTAVMIIGVITIVALLVMRLNAPAPGMVLDPGAYVLPEGVGTVGISVVGARVVVVGDDGVIRLFDPETAEMVRQIAVE